MASELAANPSAHNGVKTEIIESGSASGAVSSGLDLESRAVKQIEFYFDDSNLPYDKFMWSLHTKTDEHWVPLVTVASFKRMQEFKSLGVENLAKALKKLSTQLEVDEKLENIRRTTEVRELDVDDRVARSIYAKGFGEERPTLQKELEEFFSKFGVVRSLRMRRHETTKEFKGSVFVEFVTNEEAKAFLAVEPKPQWEGKELLLYSKQDYCEMKIKEKGLTGKAAERKKTLLSRESAGGRGFNAFREMQQKKSESDGKRREIWLDFMGKRLRVYEEDGTVGIKEDEYEMVPKATLRFDGCKGECEWADVKEPLREYFGKAPFIKFQKGDDFGLVGFDRTVTEEDFTYVKDHVPKIGGVEVTWKYADEEEDRDYQVGRARNAAQRAVGAVSNAGRGSARGRGRGRSRGRGRGGSGRGGRSQGVSKKEAVSEGDANLGDKRVRGIEPDGGPTQGVRGEAARVPQIQASKKPKLEEG